jgi:signal transduction histidine kinase
MGIQYVQSVLFKQEGSSELVREFQDYLDEVKASCDTAIDVLNSILTFDKLQNGDLALVQKSISVRTLLTDSLSPFAIQVGHNKLSILIF